jgi:CDGSH-type Zn-finger protein
MSKDQPTIEPTKNGPIKVQNLENFRNSRGENIKTQPTMFLCRCGGSNNKPFCDGTHLKNDFANGKEPDRNPDRMDDYEGESITIHDNRGVCSRRGYCTDNLPAVFQMDKEPWIDPNGAEADEVSRVIEMCPSGALSYTKDGELHKDLEREPVVIVSKDGPYEVQGGPEFRDADGNTPESKEHYTLCRCGHSKNKPFCSGQHWDIDFKDPKN